MNRRVVITGMGIISCLGFDTKQVTQSLQDGVSGISFMDEYQKMGLKSHVAGHIDLDWQPLIDRRQRRFMGDAAAYAYLSMQQAIQDAGLLETHITGFNTGLIMGTGGASPYNTMMGADTLRNSGIKKVGPYVVPKAMCSSISACLANAYQIKGLSYTMSSACATSTICIGHAYEQIKEGKQNIIFAGAGEEENWVQSLAFDALGALSVKYNQDPQKASRPYDQDRDGFVISGGGGVLVLEDFEHAIQRDAKIYAEIKGYGITSDGYDMVSPSGEGAVRCMQMALKTVKHPIDYINTHGTGTQVGDLIEIQSIQEVFGHHVPPLSSTKSLSGHSLGSAGVHEVIYCLLMLQENFIAGSINIDHLDSQIGNIPLVTKTKRNVQLNTILTNNFGFGGTNACLVLEKYVE